MAAIPANIRRPLRSAFTLIELLTVIAIIGVLTGLLLTALQSVRQAADRMGCQNKLRQLAQAALDHHDAKGKFPTGVHLSTGRNGSAWELELLGYLEQDNLQKRWSYGDPQKNTAGGRDALTAHAIRILLCPSDPLSDSVQYYNSDVSSLSGFYGVGSYGGNAGTWSFAWSSKKDGILFPDSRIRVADVTDGTSNTFFFGERSHRDKEFDFTTRYSFPDYYPVQRWGMWACFCQPAHHLLGTQVPINYQTPPWPHATVAEVRERLSAFGSGHPGGANFAFVDGSVRFLSDRIDLFTLQALSTRAGDEVVDNSP